mmetsp:Transcript_93178/g.182606  ORF Transcript_93178/g.182606 Transcript_93178/m.182606 type:complete len:252 (+) Transcript_93178:567-1322(+)
MPGASGRRHIARGAAARPWPRGGAQAPHSSRRPWRSPRGCTARRGGRRGSSRTRCSAKLRPRCRRQRPAPPSDRRGPATRWQPLPRRPPRRRSRERRLWRNRSRTADNKPEWTAPEPDDPRSEAARASTKPPMTLWAQAPGPPPARWSPECMAPGRGPRPRRRRPTAQGSPRATCGRRHTSANGLAPAAARRRAPSCTRHASRCGSQTPTSARSRRGAPQHRASSRPSGGAWPARTLGPRCPSPRIWPSTC